MISSAMNEEDNLPWCFWCILRDNESEFALPCRHIYQGNGKIIINADTLHPRFLRTEIPINKTQNEENETIHTIEQSNPKNNTDIMAKLSP